MANLRVLLLDSKDGGVILKKVINSSLSVAGREETSLDPILIQIKDDEGQQKVMAFDIGGDGIFRYQGILCVPDVDRTWESVLVEFYESRYKVYLGLTKIYHHLKEVQ